MATAVFQRVRVNSRSPANRVADLIPTRLVGTKLIARVIGAAGPSSVANCVTQRHG